jgi:hypothetical protein
MIFDRIYDLLIPDYYKVNRRLLISQSTLKS